MPGAMRSNPCTAPLSSMSMRYMQPVPPRLYSTAPIASLFVAALTVPPLALLRDSDRTAIADPKAAPLCSNRSPVPFERVITYSSLLRATSRIRYTAPLSAFARGPPTAIRFPLTTASELPNSSVRLNCNGSCEAAKLVADSNLNRFALVISGHAKISSST